MSDKVPKKWRNSEQAARSVQVAFDASAEVIGAIRESACRSGVSVPDQVRKVLGLDVPNKPRRPRLTISLSEGDYEVLAQRYGVSVDDKIEIKRLAQEEIYKFAKIKR